MSKRASKRETLKSLRSKTIALGSGKGGVGKSTTAVNLAAFYAMKGRRVGLVDLDPLSDIATILGLEDDAASDGSSGENLEAHRRSVFTNMDLLFPASKLTTAEREGLSGMLFGRFANELNRRYDILVLDLPAGSRLEDNLGYLPYVCRLIVVTNSEPTAHVSAGAYIRSALDQRFTGEIGIWHNRYSPGSGGVFDSRDVIGNYNRNVNDEVRIGGKKAGLIRDLAFIPSDPSLDLLKGNVPLLINLQQSLRETLSLIQRELLGDQLRLLGIEGRRLDFMRFFLSADSAEPPEVPREIAASLERLDRKNPMRQRVLRLVRALDSSIRNQLDSNRPFAALRHLGSNRALDREISLLLMSLSGNVKRLDSFLRNAAGILLFTFCLCKLFQSRSVVSLVDGIIPKMKNRRGSAVRDRYLQIRYLVEKDAEYRKRYFALVKTLFPVLLKQISTMVRTFDLQNLILRDRNNAINREAYLKLLINKLHDLVYSGLSIIVGFRYRPASVVFQRKAEELLAGL